MVRALNCAVNQTHIQGSLKHHLAAAAIPVSFLSPSRSRESHADTEILNLRKSPANPFLASRAIPPSLGTCCPPAIACGLSCARWEQFWESSSSLFSLLSPTSPFSATANLGFGENSLEFSPSSKNASSPPTSTLSSRSSAKLNNGGQ